MALHEVKSWAHFYDAIAEGRKLHDLRKMDREYNVGDILVLKRYDNINGKYTGEEQRVEVTYITSNKVPCAFSSSALDRDYAILSLKLMPEVAAAKENPSITVKVNPSVDVKKLEELLSQLPTGGSVRKFNGGPVRSFIGEYM